MLIFVCLLIHNKKKQKRNNKELAGFIFVMHFTFWELLLKISLDFLMCDIFFK